MVTTIHRALSDLGTMPLLFTYCHISQLTTCLGCDYYGHYHFTLIASRRTIIGLLMINIMQGLQKQLWNTFTLVLFKTGSAHQVKMQYLPYLTKYVNTFYHNWINQKFDVKWKVYYVLYLQILRFYLVGQGCTKQKIIKNEKVQSRGSIS